MPETVVFVVRVRLVSELGIGSGFAGYRIDGILGRGGMGVVYRAVDERLGRGAAVKVIAAERAGDSSFRRRFLEESRAAAAIDHPNVLPVYGAGEEDGTLYLATRLVDGTDLAKLLEDEGALDLARALAICEQVGAALDAAHARGLTHRDVKPANVLVTGEPASGRQHCYLTDFGLAQRVDRQTRLTVAGQLVGTLDYIAPEQIRGDPVDGRADLYGLGAMFYECVTGEPPFLRDSQPALLYAHLGDPPPRISAAPGGAPQALDAVLARALAKAPADRYQSGADLTAALRDALPGPRPRPSGTVPKTVVSASRSAAADGGAGAGRGGRRKALAVGAVLAAVAAAVAVALIVLLGGGGAGGEDATAGLRLTTEEIATARTLGDDTSRLASAVRDGKPTAPLVVGFETSAARAAAISTQAASELDLADPSGAAVRGAARDLRRSATEEAKVAAAPAAPAATEQAREAKRSMEGALAAIASALGAMRVTFVAEGDAEVAETVKDSITQLRRVGLTGPYDTLIAAL